MSARADWEEANARFLAAALAELRLRLELQATRGDAAALATIPRPIRRQPTVRRGPADGGPHRP